MNPIWRQTLGDLPRRTAARRPGKTAIVCGDVHWTYAEFDRICNRLAAGLRGVGVTAGERVAILSRNSHAFAALRFALARLGAVLVPINFMLNADEVAYILRHAGARLLAAGPDLVELGARAAARETARRASSSGCPARTGAEPPPGMHDLRRAARPRRRVAAERPTRRPRSLAQIVYTSGTESLPKGAMLTHEAVIWRVRELRRRRRDRARATRCCTRCRSTTARSSTCSSGPAIYVGATNVITGKPTPDNMLRADRAAPHQLVLRAADGLDRAAALAAVRHAPTCRRCAKGYYGASIMPVEVLRELRRAPARRAALELLRPDRDRAAGDRAEARGPAAQGRLGGRAVLNVETRVVDDAMHDVAAGRGRRDRPPLAAAAAGLLQRRRAHRGRVRGRLVPQRRPRHDRRRGLHHRRRPQEGHDQDRRRERRQPRGRGDDLPASPGVSEVAVIGLPHPHGSRR